MNGSIHKLSKPIKVLYIHHASGPGGAPNSLKYLIQSFPSGTLESYVLCPPGKAFEIFKEAGFKVRAIPGVSQFFSSVGAPLSGIRWLLMLRDAWHLRSGRLIRETIAEYQPDIVHLNERSMLHAAKVAKSTGVPVVMHARNVADRDTRWIHDLSVLLINNYVDMMIAIDGSVRNSMREVERCKIVYNPSRIEHDFSTSSCLASHSSSAHCIKVTFLSILLPYKGVWDLLEAASLLKHRKDVRIQIAGSNSRSQQFHKSWFGKLCHISGIAADIESEMKKKIDRESLQDTVVMLGHVKNIDHLFRDTDILVFPSHLNGPSRSVFEAGVYGIPSVISMRDKIEDVVEDGVTGLIIPEKNPVALAKALERLADDDKLRKQLGENARQKYISQFDRRKSANQVLEIYQNLIGY